MISLGLFRRRPRTRPARAPRARPGLEPLESRTVPYSASGNAWPHPELITISFQPDNTDLGGVKSNLFSTFNSDFGSASAWEDVILQAAQTWAQQANVNFTVVSDNGASSGSGNYQQGDPNYGDVRIGGCDLGDSNLLALAYMPPTVNNYSVAGDIAFNTAQVYNINGQDYDLYTVALHELGHSLGLDESNTYLADMYTYYQGEQTGLYADDVSGIQSIYGARASDGAGSSFASAKDVTSQIDATKLTAALTGLDVASTSSADYYQFTAPSGGSGALALTVQSTGLSLLAPSVTVYNASQSQLASASGSGYLGSTLSLNVNVTAGQTYYIRVTGANSTAFGTGAYDMALNLGTGASPTLSPPNTQTANGNPISGGGGVAERTAHHRGGDPMQIAPGYVPKMASPVAAPPRQGTATEAPPSPRPATGQVPPTAALAPAAGASSGVSAARSDAPAPVPQDRPAAVAPDSQGGAVPGTQAVTAPGALGIAWASQDDAAEPEPELLPPPVECGAPRGGDLAAPEAVGFADCDALFGAGDWREDGPAGLTPQAPIAGESGNDFADRPGATGAVAVMAALGLSLGLPRGSRPAGVASRRRPALPG